MDLFFSYIHHGDTEYTEKMINNERRKKSLFLPWFLFNFFSAFFVSPW